MAKIARNDAHSKLAGVLSRRAVENVARRAPLDANVIAVGLWVREWLRYARERPETFATLSALFNTPVGDCDDMVCAVAALLYRLDYPWARQWFSIGWQRGAPVHVWNTVRARETGQAISLDASTFKIPMGTAPTKYFDRVTNFPLEPSKWR